MAKKTPARNIKTIMAITTQLNVYFLSRKQLNRFELESRILRTIIRVIKIILVNVQWMNMHSYFPVFEQFLAQFLFLVCNFYFFLSFIVFICWCKPML